MKRNPNRKLVTIFAILLLCAGVANAQWNSANAYGHSTGYGTVYGSYGLAATMQSMYNVARAQSKKAASSSGSPSRETSSTTTTRSNSPAVAPPALVVRNYGMFRQDSTVDTGKTLADSLADTPETKALVKQIYASTKSAYESEAASRGWKNNIAGGLTFFTVAAMTVYHDAGEPGEDAVNTHFKLLNAALDEVPDLATLSNKDKQGFNNVMIGFGGILLAGYTEGKQNANAETLASYKKLAGMLIEMVFKTNPENLRLEDGQIVMK
jgi:hypothetical protein